ncbi:MalY/PatB family protein [Cohnella zeiphila]|uniref:cysteine-S-conjugate beta-lyase n=1 Tax=Cohnella zeiphila TaxID=2761120 RepID=A0A7X0SPD1_9BACL|nr:MalY/PatB family protein [Cohnella zeiphila]MBB6733712.1 pyridoxal phosphate-dependent aminotransferase [Cohnella zeiphila]
MDFDFDQVWYRAGTNAVKWDEEVLRKTFELKDEGGYLPLWVADMDFRTAPNIVEALRKRVEHGIFGYAVPKDDYYDAVSWWMNERHGWEIRKEWVTTTPGIVPALNFVIRALTGEGDNVLIQEPVYGPFRKVTENNGRIPVNNPLRLIGGRYEMDYEDLEEKAKDPRTKLLIVCSPHNPVGRVWTPEELRRVGDICVRHGVIVVSDEIHQDFILPGNKHTVYATLGEAFAQQAVICTAPSKTFNLASLQTSNLIVPNPELKKKIDEELGRSSIGSPNLMGIVATTAAYSPEGAQWVDAMLRYLNLNLDRMERFVEQRMPKAKFRKQEGTYLSWIDFSGLGLEQPELERRIREEAKVLLDPGSWFGEGGDGFLRVNVACPWSILEEALTRIARAVS